MVNAMLAQLGGDTGPTWMSGAFMAAGISVLCITLLRRVWRRRAASARRRAGADRTTSSTAAVRPPERTTPSTPSTTSARARHDAAMLDIEQAARTAAAQIDNRRRALESLIHEADERIATLRELTVYSASTRASLSPPANRSNEWDQQESVMPAVETRAVTPEPAASRDRLRARVFELADAGVENASIAREVGEGIGTVELLLALRAVGTGQG